MSKLIKLPGLIDVHVHLREPGNIQKEDFETGTKAAIAGGYTSVFDMPNNPNSIVTPETLDEKIKLAEGRIYCDVGFHFGGSKLSVPYFEKVKDKSWALKVYMNQTTGNLLIENDPELDKIFSKWPKTKVLMAHTEGSTLTKAINLAKRYGNRLHICHVSLADEIEQIKKAKEDGMQITCEVSCHHLFLTDQDAKSLGPFGIMKPPLSSKKDVEALWKNLDIIDMIASDHAPHTKDEKLNLEKVPFGVPGLETSLPLLLNAVNEGRVSLERVIEMTRTNPRKLFGLNNNQNVIQANTMRPASIDSGGANASQNDIEETYVGVDMGESWIIKDENLFTKCGWTPFDGARVKGRVKSVYLRGKKVFDGAKIKGPMGKIIYPRAHVNT